MNRPGSGGGSGPPRTLQRGLGGRRGRERQAVLVRLPTALAEQLRAEGARSRRWLSDTAAALIRDGMAGGGR